MTDRKIPWDERKFVRIREISEMTGISIPTIYQDIRDGKLPARKSGKIILVRPVDVDTWIEERTIAVEG